MAIWNFDFQECKWRKYERVTHVFREAVIVFREHMPTSQQQAVRSEGVTRHVWERYPLSLSGPAVLFLPKHGRLEE